MDTAKKPGDEKESKDEEDADCKEERGIDMSEDFDSKLQVSFVESHIPTKVQILNPSILIF